MIGVNVDTKWDGDDAKAITDRAMDVAVGRSAVVLSNEIQRTMPGAGANATASKTGRLKYRPSQVGQPPGVRTGRLRASVQAAKEAPGIWRAGTNVLYGSVHELSSRFPRPFMMPQVRSRITQNKMVSAFVNAARSVIERAGGAA